MTNRIIFNKDQESEMVSFANNMPVVTLDARIWISDSECENVSYPVSDLQKVWNDAAYIRMLDAQGKELALCQFAG